MFGVDAVTSGSNAFEDKSFRTLGILHQLSPLQIVNGCTLRKIPLMQNKLKWTVVVLVTLFIGLQFFSPERTNSSFDEALTLESTSGVTPEVSSILARSCNDCHSNKTDWRWYSHVAPISNFTIDHVNEGRSELNFSEWGKYNKRTKETRLTAICGLVKEGLMPLGSYVLIHPDALLSPAEVNLVCRWTEEEAKHLVKIEILPSSNTELFAGR